MTRRFLLGAALAAAGAAAAAVAFGFPSRIGISKAESLRELPGDAEAPEADVIVDRGITVQASADKVWSVIEAAFDGESNEDIVSKSVEEALVLRAAAPGSDLEEDRSGIVTIALFEDEEYTRIHLRERHYASEELPAWQMTALLTAEAPSTMMMLRDLKAAAEAL